MTTTLSPSAPPPTSRGPATGVWRYAAALGVIACTTGVAEILYRTLHTTRLSMIFLAGVLVVAVNLGSGPAYLSALAAFLVYNFYLAEPRFTVVFAGPEDVIVLTVFLLVAMLTGSLAGRVRDQAARARARANATAALLSASREFSSTSDEEVIRRRLAEHVAAAGRDEAVTKVMLDLGEAAIARARLARAEAEVQAMARTEQLRNALLSSISHDLRTPLAAILASASSLREFGDRFEPAVRDDLVLTIQEEGERLNAFVANLLNMTKLESGALAAVAENVGVAEVFDRVVQRFGRTKGARILDAAVAGERLAIRGDPVLFEQALGNIVENAIRFSPDGATVTLRACSQASGVLVEVVDDGPGVPAEDLPRIFDKFYRSPATAGLSQGTGLGLSITRGLIEAMGGEVAARRADPQRGGLVVALHLPGSPP